MSGHRETRERLAIKVNKEIRETQAQEGFVDMKEYRDYKAQKVKEEVKEKRATKEYRESKVRVSKGTLVYKVKQGPQGKRAVRVKEDNRVLLDCKA